MLRATLLMHSLLRVMQVSPGFEVSHRLTFELAFPRERYREGTAAVYQDLVEHLRALPGSEAVGSVGKHWLWQPLGGDGFGQAGAAFGIRRRCG